MHWVSIQQPAQNQILSHAHPAPSSTRTPTHISVGSHNHLANAGTRNPRSTL